jgi:hypothetical protein
MEKVRFGLHPLQEHEFVVNLANYNLIMLDENIIMALIKGFKVVQSMLITMNMKVEKVNLKHLPNI